MTRGTCDRLGRRAGGEPEHLRPASARPRASRDRAVRALFRGRGSSGLHRGATVSLRRRRARRSPRRDSGAGGSATGSFSEHGVTLFGGATLPEARGRGAYRALVRARWDDAVARGTPLAVTDAGSQSRPILARLGFREVCTIRALIDRI